MKKLLNGESHSHSLLCGDNQFQAALSMVARSRSPLPPSPTSVTTLLDSEICFSSVKPLLPFYNSSGNSSFLVSSSELSALLPPPPLRPKQSIQSDLPPQPPRKPVLALEPAPVETVGGVGGGENVRGDTPEPLLSTHDTHSQPPAYDDVEVRNEAWRTMGVDVVSHQDVFKAVPVQTVPHRTVSPKLDKPESQKVFHVPTNNGIGNYDRLQHIGPVPKQNIAPGYKQIPFVTNSLSNIRIEEPIFACRRADDFKGYGMIRKKTSVDASTEDVSKQFLNEDIKYAIVCKPERV